MPFLSPTNLDAALDLVARAGSRVIAGGTDFFAGPNQAASSECYVDVTRIAGLSGIARESGDIRIGAASTWSDVVNADLPAAFDGLKAAALEVGSIQIQNAGTIAGNLCNASPAADGVPPLLTLDARVELASAARGTRQLPLASFIKGVRSTTRADDEIVTAILIPAVPEGAMGAFGKLGSRRYLVISITMTAVLILCDGDGRIVDARVAVGACSPVAQRLPELESALVGQRSCDVHVLPEHLAALAPIDDVRGTAAYRLDVVAEQCNRVIRKAAGRDDGVE